MIHRIVSRFTIHARVPAYDSRPICEMHSSDHLTNESIAAAAVRGASDERDSEMRDFGAARSAEEEIRIRSSTRRGVRRWSWGGGVSEK